MSGREDPGQDLFVDLVGPETADVAPGGQDPMEGSPVLRRKGPSRRIGGPLSGTGAVADGRHRTGPRLAVRSRRGHSVGAYDRRRTRGDPPARVGEPRGG